ncbi:MAG: chemotaxis protein CheW [Oscillospiraceae bacterium]
MGDIMDISKNFGIDALGDNTETEGKYLTFFTDNQLFGVPIADVLQIVGIQKITSIPELPVFVKGIINLRGTVISVIDMRLRLRKEEIGYNERTCIIVTNIDERSVGFIVDAVDEVAKIDAANISEPPKISGDAVNSYLTGIAKQGSKVILLVDTEKISAW